MVLQCAPKNCPNSSDPIPPLEVESGDETIWYAAIKPLATDYTWFPVVIFAPAASKGVYRHIQVSWRLCRLLVITQS